VTTRIAAIASARRITSYPCTTTGADPITGQPTLPWWFDRTTTQS
jgi:hypothetical protein